MLNSFFCDITSGRLARVPFLGYSVLLLIVFVAIGAGIGVAIGVAEHLAGGDLQSAQAQLREQFGIPAILLVSLVATTLVFVGLNLEAKRIRDIGLPGWWAVLGIFLAGAFISYTVSEQASGSFHSLVYLILLIVPGKTFGRIAE
ncbi:MAG: DUF805 domain-containing protein [Gammaproteobacteria bacterium]|nr:DUF805 domain-containing protein [Gammaproteobacteria bacterium]